MKSFTIHNYHTPIKQLYALTRANVRARYRKTVAGFVWVMINPILLFLAQATIFKYVLKINLENYYVFIISGLIPWTFITSTIQMGTTSLQNSKDLLKSFKIPPQILVWSTVLDNLITLSCVLTILIIPMLLMGKISPIGLPFIPIAIIIIMLGIGGLVSLLAYLQIFFRDTTFIVAFLLNILFFATPIFYPKSFLPSHLRWIAEYNPLYILIEPFVISLHRFSFNDMLLSLSKAILAALFFLYLSHHYWMLRRNEFYARL